MLEIDHLVIITKERTRPTPPAMSQLISLSINSINLIRHIDKLVDSQRLDR
jgi:hypothetical protein